MLIKSKGNVHQQVNGNVPILHRFVLHNRTTSNSTKCWRWNHVAEFESSEIVQRYSIVRQKTDEQCDSIATIIKGKIQRRGSLYPMNSDYSNWSSVPTQADSVPDWLLIWQSINRKGNRWKSVVSISNIHVFRKVCSCTLPVPVLANRLRYLFLSWKTKRKTLFIITLSTDLGSINYIKIWTVCVLLSLWSLSEGVKF